MYKVLVCGGRDFKDYRLLQIHLNDLLLEHPDMHIIHGGAKGADTLAGVYAHDSKIPCWVFPARWEEYGKGAGHIRNALMLTDGEPDMVLAMPGGVGTATMVERAGRAGVTVRQISICG